MNLTEALMNKQLNLKQTMEGPAQFLGGSVPGLGMSYDRKKQLLIIDQNLNQQREAALKNTHTEGNLRRSYDPNMIMNPAGDNYGLYDNKNISSGVYDKRIINQHEQNPMSKSVN